MSAVQSSLGDLRFAARQLRRNLPLTVAALLCFALGVGANTSIFSVVNAVLFRPLPFPESGRLVRVSEGVPKLALDISTITAPDLLDFKATEGRAFESLALVQRRGATIMVNDEADVVPAAALTPSVFTALRVAPAMGRAFLAADTVTGAPLVVVISDALWRRRYGADRSLVGKPITFASGATAQVIGIMRPGFVFPLPGLGIPVADIFFPFRFSPAVLNQRADMFNTIAFGRLQDGVSPERAEAALGEIMRQLPQRYPESWGKAAANGGTPLIHVKSLRDAAVSQTRGPLLILLGAVGFVLLIACINVASLFVARASARRREIAIRKALGATRGRLTQQFLAEALLLLSAGSALGLLAAHWGTRALVALAPGEFYTSFDTSLDGRVLLVTGALTALTSLVFAILPGLRNPGGDAEQSLRSDRSATASRAREHGRRVLIVSEVAFALLLTIGAGLLLRSFARAQAVNPGLDPENVVTFSINLPASAYPDAGRLTQTEQQILQRLREVPGITGASATSSLPMQGSWEIVFTPEGPPQAQLPVGTNTLVLPGFFEAMRIPLRAGRYLGERDARGAPGVVVINETMAKKYYGKGNPVGRQFKLGPPDSPVPPKEIVGVVADVKQYTLDEATIPAVYQPVLQQDTTGQMMGMYRGLTYVVRTSLPPAGLAPALRTAVRDVDPRLAVLNVQSMETIVGGTIASRKFNATLVALFAALALLLAASGVYGVLQYSVIQRKREMGIRIAIGATSTDLVRLVVGQAVGLAALGVAIGAAGAVALTRLMRSLLFNTSALDVATFAAGAAVLLAVTAAASYLPARRALRTDPTVAMRAE